MSSTAEAIRIFDPKLSETGQIDIGPGAGRIAFASEDTCGGMGSSPRSPNAILVIHPLAKQPLGKLSYPGKPARRSLSLDGRSGTYWFRTGTVVFDLVLKIIRSFDMKSWATFPRAFVCSWWFFSPSFAHDTGVPRSQGRVTAIGNRYNVFRPSFSTGDFETMGIWIWLLCGAKELIRVTCWKCT